MFELVDLLCVWMLETKEDQKEPKKNEKGAFKRCSVFGPFEATAWNNQKKSFVTNSTKLIGKKRFGATNLVDKLTS